MREQDAVITRKPAQTPEKTIGVQEDKSSGPNRGDIKYMATETIVAVFDTAAQAEKAIRELQAAGVSPGSIQHYAEDNGGYEQSASTHAGSGQGFWSWLFGDDTAGHDRTLYDRTLKSGGTVLTVTVEDSQAERVVSTLEANSPVDLEERASQYRLDNRRGKQHQGGGHRDRWQRRGKRGWCEPDRHRAGGSSGRGDAGCREARGERRNHPPAPLCGRAAGRGTDSAPK